MAGLYIDHAHVNLGKSHLAFAGRYKARSTQGFSTKLGKRSNDQSVNADQVQFGIGELAFGLDAAYVRPLKNQVGAGFRERLAHQVSYLFA